MVLKFLAVNAEIRMDKKINMYESLQNKKLGVEWIWWKK